jgi:DNA-binding transcriptional regulator GbsR (MarR family)
MKVELTPAQQRFILHWGEMSSHWGINRSAAQVHALLYLSEEPLNAEQIAERLALARSNVSTSLRELRAWGVVQVVHRLGDRRDYFQSVSDVWEMFLTILEQRKQREIDPTLAMLRGCVAEQQGAAEQNTYITNRMREMLDLLELVASGYEQIKRLSPTTQRRVLQLGSRLERIVGEEPDRRRRHGP